MAAVVPEFEYVGGELALFERAVNWKSYWSGQIAKFLHGDVLEVGAGIGANTRTLAGFSRRSWTCLEPDKDLASQIQGVRVVVGTLADLGADEQFDSILYIDVLEHIDADREELMRAALHLRRGGHLIVLSPAHSWLYTPFDQAIGHFRRYSVDSLRAAGKGFGLEETELRYLDSVGLLASLANRLFLRQSMPTEQQILTWDRLLVPVSRSLDPLTRGRVGKSVLGVWTKDK